MKEEMRRKPRKKLKLLLVIIISIATLLLVAAWKFGDSDKQRASDSQKTPTQRKEIEKPDTTIRLVASGDMLPHDTVNQAAKLSGDYDYTKFFTHVKPYFTEADITFCNQESPSSAGLSVTGYPTFNAPPKFSKDLNTVGCNLIALANNHSYDRGQTGINGTLDTWDGLAVLAKAGIYRNASEQQKIAYFEKKNVKFAFLAYTDCSNNTSAPAVALNQLNKPFVSSQIAEAKQNADMLIVSTHWCKENSSVQTSAQDEWAQYFADQGVQIVIGTGPHFLQSVKKLPRVGGGDTIVWFSLGNFLSTQEQVNGLIGGIAVMDIDIATKNVTKLSFLPTYMHYEWTASEKAAGNLLARKNLMLYPLADAREPLARSQNGTTVDLQMTRVTELMNKYTSVQIRTK